jgi:hypothetical protein
MGVPQGYQWHFGTNLSAEDKNTPPTKDKIL